MKVLFFYFYHILTITKKEKQEENDMQNELFITNQELTFEDFRGHVMQAILSINVTPKITVEKKDVLKTNDECCHGIGIRRDGSIIGPVKYLDDSYDAIKKGIMTEESVIRKIVAETISELENVPTISADDLTLFNIGNKIFPCLVKTSCNQKFLEDVVHEDFLDLSIIYKVFLNDGRFGADKKGTISITDPFLKKLGLTAKGLHDLAFDNFKHSKRYVNTMSGTLEEIGGKDDFPEMDEIIKACTGNDMFVLSNEDKLLGASVIMDTDLLSKLSNDIFGGDFFIIPSSIHEVLAISTKSWSAEEINQMINEVNANSLDADDVLSDHVYLYDSKSNTVTYDCSVSEKDAI